MNIRLATNILVGAYVLLGVSWAYIFFGRYVLPKVVVAIAAMPAAFAFIYAHQGAAVLFSASAFISGASLYRSPSARTVGVIEKGSELTIDNTRQLR